MSYTKEFKQKMCYSKKVFNSESRAKKSAEPYNQRTYECPICGNWHNTSKEGFSDLFITKEKHTNTIHSLNQEIKKLVAKVKDRGKVIEELETKLYEYKKNDSKSYKTSQQQQRKIQALEIFK